MDMQVGWAENKPEVILETQCYRGMSSISQEHYHALFNLLPSLQPLSNSNYVPCLTSSSLMPALIAVPDHFMQFHSTHATCL